MFALGIIIGFLTATLIVTVLVYFRRPIEQKTKVIETAIGNAGPRPRGFIFNPMSEADEVREKIIEKNKKEGRDTPIKDLL